MKTDILIRNAAQMATCAGCDRPRRGKEMSYDIIMEDGWIAVAAGKIMGIGRGDIPGEIEVDEDTLVIDASGKTVLPGFVDPHILSTVGPGKDTLKLEECPTWRYEKGRGSPRLGHEADLRRAFGKARKP